MALRTDLSLEPSPSAVEFALTVTNDGTAPLDLRFPSAQTVEVEVYEVDGAADEGPTSGQPAEPAWRFGDSRMFTQAINDATLEPGEALQLDATWEAPAPGGYRAVAYPTAAPEARAEREFTVEGD